MQELIRKGIIYLSGGGDETQTLPLDKIFFNTLPKDGLFLYIPVALRGHKLYPTAHSWMKGVIALHSRRDVHFKVIDDTSNYTLKQLKEFCGIYIGGGNTWNLMQEIKDTGFSDILIQYIQNGGRVYGGSAGAIIMGKRIDVCNDKNKIGTQDVRGLNLLNGFSVACHFKNEQGDTFHLWAATLASSIICLPEESGLFIENDLAVCVGTKPCMIYYDDGERKEIHPEESFRL